MGMDLDEVINLYMKKNELNHKRQDNGYNEGTYKKIINGNEDNSKLFEGIQ